MSTGVKFDLLANDLISPVLNKIKASAMKINGLVAGMAIQGPDLPDGNKVADGFNNAAKSSSVFWGTFKANLAMGALSQTLGLVQKLGAALGDAGRFQTLAIAQASDVSTNLGVGVSEARALVENTQMKVADIAAALPGVTKDYNDIFQAIGATVAEQHRGNAEAFQEASLEMTKRVGVLAAIRNVSGQEAGSAFNRLLAGTMGYGEARQLDLLQKNPMLQKSIERQLAAIGATTRQWTKLSQPQRYDILMGALKDAVPDTLVSEFSGTTESILQTWQTSLLDPLKGIFGMMRRVKGANNRSTLDAFQGFLQSWDGFAMSAVKLAKAKGLNIDPMMGVIEVFDYLSDIGNRYTQAVVRAGKGGFTFFSGFADVTSDVVADILNSVIKMIAGIDLGMLLEGFSHIIQVLFLALGKVDWGSLLVAGLKLLAIAVVGGLLAGLGIFISGLGAIPIALIALSVAALATVVVWGRRLITGISGIFVKGWEGIQQIASGLWDGAKSAITRFFEWVGSIWNDIKNKVVGFVTNPVQAVTKMVPQGVKDVVKGEGVVGGIAKAAVGMVNPLAGPAMNLLGGVMGDKKPKDPLATPQANTGLPLATPPVNPLVSSLPTLTPPPNPIVSSLPLTSPGLPGMDSGLPSTPLAIPQTTNSLQANNTFAPQISIPITEGSSTDPNAIASLVVDKLGQLYKQHQQGKIG